MRDIHVKIIAAVLAVILVLFLVFETSKTKELQRNNSELEIETSELRREKKQLQKQLDAMLGECVEKKKGELSFMLVFSEIDDSFFNEIVPLLNQHNVSATLCITRENLPVINSVLSLYEINYLTNSGWQLAMAWDGKEELESWYLDTTRLMSEVGVEIPRVLLLESSLYTSSLDENLVSLGFTDAVVRLSSFDKQYESSHDSLNVINAYNWYTTEGAEKLSGLNSVNSELAFVIGVNGQELAYEASQFEAMINNAITKQNEDKLNFATPESAVVYRESNELEYQKALDEYNDKAEELKKSIQEIDTKINSIYSEYATKK